MTYAPYRVCAQCNVIMMSEFVYISVFQPFGCSGTPHKHGGHSQNPVQWSLSPATYPRLKIHLHGVYGLITLAGQSPYVNDKVGKDDQL